jgi:hypothetical protein
MRCLDADAAADLLLRGLVMSTARFICYAHIAAVCSEQRGNVTMSSASGAELMPAVQASAAYPPPPAFSRVLVVAQRRQAQRWKRMVELIHGESPSMH